MIPILRKFKEGQSRLVNAKHFMSFFGAAASSGFSNFG